MRILIYHNIGKAGRLETFVEGKGMRTVSLESRENEAQL